MIPLTYKVVTQNCQTIIGHGAYVGSGRIVSPFKFPADVVKFMEYYAKPRQILNSLHEKRKVLFNFTHDVTTFTFQFHKGSLQFKVFAVDGAYTFVYDSSNDRLFYYPGCPREVVEYIRETVVPGLWNGRRMSVGKYRAVIEGAVGSPEESGFLLYEPAPPVQVPTIDVEARLAQATNSKANQALLKAIDIQRSKAPGSDGEVITEMFKTVADAVDNTLSPQAKTTVLHYLNRGLYEALKGLKSEDAPVGTRDVRTLESIW